MKAFRSRKKADVSSFKPKSHAGAVVLALQTLARARPPRFSPKVQKQRKIKTSMDKSQAVSWMVFELRRRGFS